MWCSSGYKIRKPNNSMDPELDYQIGYETTAPWVFLPADPPKFLLANVLTVNQICWQIYPQFLLADFLTVTKSASRFTPPISAGRFSVSHQIFQQNNPPQFLLADFLAVTKSARRFTSHQCDHVTNWVILGNLQTSLLTGKFLLYNLSVYSWIDCQQQSTGMTFRTHLKGQDIKKFKSLLKTQFF